MLEELNRDEAQVGAPNDLQSFWQPFTPNRQFKAHPRLVVSAKGMHYRSHDGRDILDSSAGLWCANLGHCHPQGGRGGAAGHRDPRLRADLPVRPQQGVRAGLAGRPRDAGGSEPRVLHQLRLGSRRHGAENRASPITAPAARGRAHRLIGRERAYHGVGFGGISVGGMVANRRTFGPMLPGVDHLRHTLDLERNAFARGQPRHGKELADDLERLCACTTPRPSPR